VRGNLRIPNIQAKGAKMFGAEAPEWIAAGVSPPVGASNERILKQC